MLMQKLLSSCGGTETLYSDDVFSAYLRTGTGADVTVTTGIDMTKGYMLWSKGRSGATDHAIYDSARGVTYDLVSNSTAAQTTQVTGLKAVSSTGHTIGSLAKMNTSAATYVDFVFRKAPKFFDCGTYTGNGSTQVINHALGIAPGMVIIKETSASGRSWQVWHRGISAGYRLVLDSTAAQTNSNSITTFGNNSTYVDPTATEFTVGSLITVNNSSSTYVWYAFAHDTSTDGIIQCGSYTGNGSAAGPTINLGWEPQFLIIKNTTSAQNWYLLDSARGMPVGSADANLIPNLSNAEAASTVLSPTATGFQLDTAGSPNQSGESFIYLAIRRPNKPPTTGTQVYNAIARTGTGDAATVTGVGFAPDLIVNKSRSNAVYPPWWDRLRGATNEIRSDSTAAEAVRVNGVTAFESNGYKVGNGNFTEINNSGWTYVDWLFRRAPGCFDVVCYTGTIAQLTVSHNLGVPPEMVIIKTRAIADNWYVWHKDNAPQGFVNACIALNSASNTRVTAANALDTFTGSSFRAALPGSVTPAVAYLFATKAGISKVGSYTGNGGTQTIDCGFTTGCRFFLVKASSTTGSWWIFDSVRGVISAADPALQLNSTAAEITSADAVDPSSVGIIVNQEATCSINANGVSYIYLAFA